MLHIRLTFIGIKTGWAPKTFSWAPGNVFLGAQLTPGEKMLSFVPGPSWIWLLDYEYESRSGDVYSIQHYVIKFVSDL